MEDQIYDILTELLLDNITKQQATDQLLVLYSVSGSDLAEELLEQHKIRIDIEDGHELPKWAVRKIERWQSAR
jgi:hypothetical protein